MNARTWTGPALLLCAILLWPAVAAAQFDPFMPVPIPPLGPAQPAPQTVAPQRSQTVTERPRPLYDALGIRLEEFFLYPRLELDESYNDNIFATSSGAKSDFITDLKPRLDLVSNFGRHAFNLSAGADIGWYATHSTENYQDAFTSASGRYDIDQGRHTVDNAGLGYGQEQLPVSYRGDLSVQRSEYQAMPAVGGGQINQSDRNNTT